MKSFSRRVLLGFCLPLLAATVQCYAADAQPARPKLGEIWQETKLYFGTSQPDGSVVTDAQFARFVDNQVTPRFPDGLTLLAGYGQFKNSSGTINKEKSFVLILYYPLQTKDANKNIEDIRRIYTTRFNQESVLRADGLANISF